MEVYYVKFIFAFFEYRANHDVKLAIVVPQFTELSIGRLESPVHLIAMFPVYKRSPC